MWGGRTCVFVYVCVCDRETQRERAKEIEIFHTYLMSQETNTVVNVYVKC